MSFCISSSSLYKLTDSISSLFVNYLAAVELRVANSMGINFDTRAKIWDVGKPKFREEKKKILCVILATNPGMRIYQSDF